MAAAMATVANGTGPEYLLKIGSAGAQPIANHFDTAGIGAPAGWTDELDNLTGLSAKCGVLAHQAPANAAGLVTTPYTPTGAFRIEAQIATIMDSTAARSAGLIVKTAGNGEAGQDGVLVILNTQTNEVMAFSLDSGTYNLQGSLPVGSLNQGYFAIARDGSNNWMLQFSIDRNLWLTVATFAKTFTVARAGFRSYNLGICSAEFIDTVV